LYVLTILLMSSPRRYGTLRTAAAQVASAGKANVFCGTYLPSGYNTGEPFRLFLTLKVLAVFRLGQRHILTLPLFGIQSTGITCLQAQYFQILFHDGSFGFLLFSLPPHLPTKNLKHCALFTRSIAHPMIPPYSFSMQ